ncbi:hypothetical protein AB434_1720 [Heyndrickxia coagulans]|uniref:Uncharacterized protein n=1 Tax=Heyndrickxia coagulans TaxID=1398 RepID=A0A0C5CFI8_HEYCO|nr:hypothetical protein BCO26_0379 [Heyndrickxia coagulans 2-6]AJO24415.1 hypothetical protein SB48_HM08orf05759 [Heyndrickxia coagulans]AKN54125.1 hypothetical protein AB434_1720 [Heyndrickxia coagulans]KWZ85984.1 hypothetical protein HMPREF3213_00226 [Heyndrickxia coagulans]KYC62702.1 hypothetical protein B4100_0913 [Heyndrickxia coagulans]
MLESCTEKGNAALYSFIMRAGTKPGVRIVLPVLFLGFSYH